MNYSYYTPEEPLSSFVKCFWLLNSSSCSEEQNCNIILPTGCIELVFYYGDVNSNKRKNSKSYGVVAGQRTSRTEIFPSCYSGLISAMLRPEAAGLILGDSAYYFSGSYVDAESVFGSETSTLYDKLSEAKTDSARFIFVESFLKTRIKKTGKVLNKRIVEGINQLSRIDKNMRIDTLAEILNLSKRQMERVFLSEVGLAPKNFARVLRFQKVFAVRNRKPYVSLTELAYECGFSDQAHFINDFKSLSGFTPKEYFKTYPAYSDYFTFL